MRSGFIWVVVLLAGVGAWFLFFGGGAGDELTNLPGVDEPPAAGAPEGGPELMGSGADRPHVPVEIRGRSMLQGMTRRGGIGVAAEVELRHVVEIDPKDPFRGGIERLFIERMLDSGISGKPAIARTQAGDDGRFRFTGLAPGLYEVRAVAASGAMGLVSAMLPAAGARVEVNVDLPDGDVTLKGRAVYANGKPYQGLVILTAGREAMSAMMGGAAAHVRPATTDKDGRFEISSLSAGGYQLSAIIPGQMRVMGAPLMVPHAGEYVLTINAAGVTVKGKVIRAKDEQPIAGAVVFGGGGDPSTSLAIFSTKSAADGTFTMTIPAGRGGGMFVRAEGYAPQMVEFRGRAEADPVVVTMLALGKLTGRVTAKEGGQPIKGVPVFATNEGRSMGFGGNLKVAVTDADGRYAFPGLPPGAVKLHVLGKGWVSVGMQGVGLGSTATPYVAEIEPGGSAEQDLEVGPAGAVHGRVLDAGGRPVAGAVIQAGGPDNLARVFSSLLGMGIAFGSTVSDADGAYAIDALVPGTTYKLAAKAPEHPDAASEPFTVEAGRQMTIDVTFAQARWFDVRVLASAGGQPVSGATIVAQPKERSKGRLRLGQMFGVGTMWTTDGDGKARVGPLASGELRIRAVAPGFIEDGEDVTAEQEGQLTITLEKGLVLAGTVHVPDGIPPQSIRVTVQSAPQVRGRWFRERVAVGADGTWRVTSIKDPGEYRVMASGEWKSRSFEGGTVADAGSEDVVIELRESERTPESSIEVIVTDADGKAVPSGRVQLTRFREERGSNSTRTRLNSGKATFSGFDGEGELWVEVFDLIGRSRGATIQGPLTVVDGKVAIRLPRGQSISGVVRDGAGKGVAGVRVAARPQHPRDSSEHGREHGKAVSDGEGRFTLSGLGPYEYQLKSKASRDTVPIDAVDARAGAKDVVIVARQGVKAQLTLRDPDGKPVAEARVQLSAARKEGDASGYRRSFGGNLNVSNASGVVTLRGLAPEQAFDLNVYVPQGRLDLKRIELKGWSPKDETLTFERAYAIVGKVVDKAGKPAQRVRVEVRKKGDVNDRSTVWVQEDGSFTLNQLESGDYEVRALPQGITSHVRPTAPGGPDPEEQGWVTVRAGARDVRIVVDLGGKLVVKIAGRAPDRGGSGRSMQALLLQEGGSGTRLSGSWKRGDTVEFRGLVDGATYRLWIGGGDGGKYALREGVKAQAAVLNVTLRSGGTIRGHVRLPAGATAPRGLMVNATLALGIGVSVQADPKTGAFEIRGLPEGTVWRLSAYAWVAKGGSYRGDLPKVTVGADVEIELKKP